MKIPRHVFYKIIILISSYYIVSFSAFYLLSQNSFNFFLSLGDTFNLLGKAFSAFKITNPTLSAIFGFIISLVVIYSLLKYKKYAYPLSKKQLQNLVELNFGFIEETEIQDKPGHRKLKKTLHEPYFSQTEDFVELGTFNTKITNEEIQNQLESLSNILKTELIEVVSKRNKGDQIIFTLAKNIFEKIQVENKAQSFYSLLAGKNIKNLAINLDLKSAFSIFIGGTSGSGKTKLILHYIKQIFDSVNGDLEIIIIDDKGVDYKQLVSAYNAKYFDSSSLEDLEAFNNKLKQILELKNQTKSILASNNVEHAENIRQNGIQLPLHRTLILCDEAGAYLRYKDESRKEYKEIKKEIVSNLTICLSQLRAFGCPIIVASQRVAKDEMQIPYSNFQIRLINGVEIEFSRKYCAGLVSDKAIKGKWYINSEQFSGFIKTPFEANLTFEKINQSPLTDAANKINSSNLELIHEASIASLKEVASNASEIPKKQIEKKNKMAHFWKKEKV